MPHSFIPFLLFLLLTSTTNARLTQNGLPTGQTVIPIGKHHLTHRPPQQTRPQNRQRPRQKHPRSPSIRPNHRICPSSDAPFQTLRNTACPLSLYTPRKISSPTLLSIPIRTVTASQLSAIFLAASFPPLPGPSEPVIVLFHGGPSCPWSSSILEAWLHAQQLYRHLCLLTIDAAADSMLNYNLMVLGFPTVMRIRSDRSAETFRGNRTKEQLVAWIYRVTGVPPMTDYVPEQLFVGKPAPREEVHFGDDGESVHDVNWPLLGANFVTVLNVTWFALKAVAAMRRRFGEKHARADLLPVPPGSPLVHDDDGTAG